MKKRLFLILLIGFCVSVYSQELVKIEASEAEEQDLSEIYNRINELKKQGVEIHYQKETVIKESEIKDERGYLKHLLSELETALKKGKKDAKINRVEGNLVEIDKGAIHKVHDRDVYIVYDSSGKYKGKVEIGAIADAISIGRSYEIKKGETLEPGDTINFRGNRKFFEYGIFGGGKRHLIRAGGLIWKWNFRGAWGIEHLWGTFSIDNRVLGETQEGMIRDTKFDIPTGIRKYFNYPSWISPYTVLGLSYYSGEYKRYMSNEFNIVETFEKKRIVPYLSGGIQLFSNKSLHIDLEARYFHGPVIKIWGREIKERPVSLNISISTSW